MAASQPTRPPFTCELPAPSWAFRSGKGLDSQSLTAWETSYGALVLVTTIAGVEEFSDAFNVRVSATRNNADPVKLAAAYLPRNTTETKRRQPLASIFVIAALATSYRDMVNRLVWACGSPISERAVARESLASLDGPSIPELGDRQKAFRDSWKQNITLGARLLALRGSSRCMACETDLDVAEFYRDPLADSERRVRADYCSDCEADDDHLKRIWRHRNAIRAVLDAAAPALTKPGVELAPWDNHGTMTTRFQRS